MASSSSSSSSLSTTSMKMVAASNNTLGLKLYHLLRSEDTDNMIFSPLSISTALTMTYMGARGNTAQQMQEVMALAPLGEDVHSAFKDHNAELLGRSKKYILNMANRLYGQKKYKFQPDFLNATQEFYGAKMEALDFGSESAREAINIWVEEQTDKRIKDLISPVVLTPDTCLVLVNAIYFKGEWALPFGKHSISDMPFHRNPSEKILVPTMFQIGRFEYYHDESLKCKVLRMGYKESQVGMMIILPDSIDGHAKLETELSVETIQNWSTSLKLVKVRVSLPKFKFTKSFNLAEKLSGSGMTDLFSELAADLTGISTKGEDELFVSDVIHKAFLEVNEAGCEAAAATAVGMKLIRLSLKAREPEPKEFKADHPFLFFIQSVTSEAIVFMGRVIRPVQS